MIRRRKPLQRETEFVINKLLFLYLAGISVLTVLFLLPGCSPAPPVTVISPSSSSAWTPDPTLLSQLGPEVTMDGFSIRPPQNCTLVQSSAGDAQNTLVRYEWVQKRQDGSTLIFSIHVAHANPGYALEPDVVVALQGLTDHNGADFQNYAHSNIEKGFINGVPFARVYWKGRNPPDSPRQHGFFYLTSTEPYNITVHGTDSEPYHQQTLPLCEAAALTFRLLKQ